MDYQKIKDNDLTDSRSKTFQSPQVDRRKNEISENILFQDSSSINLSSNVPQSRHELSVGEFPWVNARQNLYDERFSSPSVKNHIPVKEELNTREIPKKSKPTEHHHNLYMSKLETDIPSNVEEKRASLSLKDIVRSGKRQRPKCDVAGPKAKRRNNEIDSSLSSSIGILNPSFYQSNIRKRVKKKIRPVEQKSVEVQTDTKDDKEADKTRKDIIAIEEVPKKVVKPQVVTPEVTEPMANAILSKFSKAFPELLETKQVESEAKKEEQPNLSNNSSTDVTTSEPAKIQFPVPPNLFSVKPTSNELPNFGIPPANLFNSETTKAQESAKSELPKPALISSEAVGLPKLNFGTNSSELTNPTFGTSAAQLPKPTFGATVSELPKPTFGATVSELTKPTFGATVSELPKPTFGATGTELPKPTFGISTSELPKSTFEASAAERPKVTFGATTTTAEPTKFSFGSGGSEPKPTFGSDKPQPFKFTFGVTSSETTNSNLQLATTKSETDSLIVTSSSPQIINSETKPIESKAESVKDAEINKTENTKFTFGSTWEPNKSQNSDTGPMKLFGMPATMTSLQQTFGTTNATTASTSPIFSIAKDTPKFSAVETSKSFSSTDTTKAIFTAETPKPLFGNNSVTSQGSKPMFNLGNEAFKVPTTVTEALKTSDASKSLFGTPKTVPEIKNIFGGVSTSGNIFGSSASLISLPSKTDTISTESKSIFGQIDSKTNTESKSDKLPSLFNFGKKETEKSSQQETNTQFGQSLFNVSKPEVKEGFKFDAKPFVFTGGKTESSNTFGSFGATPSFGQPSSSTLFQTQPSFNPQTSSSFSQPQTFAQQQPQTTFTQQQPQTSFTQQAPTFGQSVPGFGVSSQPQISFNQPSMTFGSQSPFGQQPQQHLQQQPQQQQPSFGQSAPFTFGQSSAPSFNFTAQPQQQTGLFQFGAAAQPTSPAFNFSAQNMTPQNPGFNFGGFTPPAGQMFSIGSGSTAPRNRTALRRKK